MGDALTRYHISLDVADRAGVLATVAGVFARHDVSIATVRQSGRASDATLVIVTHVAPDAALAATVEELRTLDIVRSIASVLRVEGEELRCGAASSRPIGSAYPSARPPPASL